MPDYTPESRSHLRLCDLPVEERPRERLYYVGERALSTTELLAIVIGSGHGNDNVLQLAQLLLSDLDGLSGLARASTHELRQVKGIGEVKAAQIKAALELGRRATKAPRSERPIVRSPAEAANLLMPEMCNLEQEHTRAILLNTRNHVLSMPTIYTWYDTGVAMRLLRVSQRPAPTGTSKRTPSTTRRRTTRASWRLASASWSTSSTPQR